MRSLKIFENFKFSDLNEDWIQSVWDREFMIYNEPPDEYLMFLESEDMRLLLHECCTVIRAWLEGDKESTSSENHSEISWNTLIVMDVKVRALLAILGYIIKNGQSKDAEKELKQSCLYATNLYFVLLAIPGSNAFNVFHPNLYQGAIDTLKVCSEQLQPSIKKRNRAMNLDDLSIVDELMNEQVSLSSYEKEVLIKNLNIIIRSLVMMIKSFWFKDNVQSLDITIHGLLELTKMEDNTLNSQHFNRQTGIVELSLPQNAYAALQELCNDKHGSVKVTITLIAKYILPRLLCSHTDAQVKVMTNIQDHTIHFLKVLQHAYEKEAKRAILTLIQHLMLKCPDRLEARQRQAVVLLKLFAICKQNIAMEAFNDLILLSHHSKISFRLFSQEIIGKLLLESFLINFNISDALKVKLKHVFFAIVLSRCVDCSSMVRGKAMAIIAEFTESENQINKAIFQAIFEESDPGKKFATFCDIKGALYKNTDLLPGSYVIIDMLNERIEDERAMVRRSTMQILRNLVLRFPALIDKVIPIMSCRCRDSTLTVRRFAVQVLSQLLGQYPDNCQLLNEWVQTVVPQIFDIEIKVQEKVLDYLEELLLKKIGNVSTDTENSASSLPWKILNVIMNMKMRKHLSKACSLWVKNGIITSSVMRNIQSHIGTNNNVEAWVFLVALAENTSLPNMNKYFSNYKTIFLENNFCTSLVLQVLKYSWKSLDHDMLENLHIYLYECLQQYRINFGLISICLDIIHNIIHYLNPDKDNNLLESNMMKLIKVSEIEIAKIFNSDADAIDAAPNYLKAMFTLGHAMLFTTAKISPLTLRILQGILLEWETLPEVIKEIEELQASAVVILGQQAMRDREVAKEVIPIFGRLMRQDTDLNSVTEVAVKINAAKALADICVRFTALAEPYLSDMCVSMKNSSPQIREAIMVIFIQLLLEDYIKVKGPFFFHILTMLSDSDNMIRELTIFLIEERLLTKNKTLISQQFLQSIYHYNNYQSQHKVYHHKMRENEKRALTLPGNENEDKRRAIYDFMLDHLDPPGKIKLLVKVTSQILGGTCVDSIDVKKEEGACVLKDALYIISNDRLRPSSFMKHNDDDQQDGEESVTQTTAPATNAINIIIEGIKKHSLEVLLPLLVKLRMKLSILKSSLENDVKVILVKTYLEHSKDQLANLISEYPKLEKEIGQFKKQLENVRSGEENITVDESSPTESVDQSPTNRGVDLTSCNLNPKIVLRRISLSQASNYTRISENSCSPASTIDGWDSGRTNMMLHSPCEPGPSTSTPKTFRSLDFNSNTAGVQASKARRLSAYFQNEKGIGNAQHKIRKKNVLCQDDSD